MEEESLFLLKNAIPKYSKGPMTAHQKDLPKLPLPPLINSMEKYLIAVKPLLTAEDYQITENVVKKFCTKDGIGQRLYSILEEQYRNLDNWIEERWIKEIYLKQREPISPVYTPSIYILKTNFESEEEKLRFASSVIHSIVGFKTMIDRHQVMPDTLKGNLMDMSQYFLLFSTTQVPCEKCDNFVHFRSSKHIVIAFRNKFFQVNVFNEDETSITSEELYRQLQIIKSHTKESIPVGVMTTQHRDIWVKVYQRLCEDEENRQTIEKIQSALFIVCLDKEVTDLTSPDIIRNVHNFVHGCGPSINGGNRWFDCGIQIIFTEDGVIGLNSGSTPLEAQPFERMIEYSLAKTMRIKEQEYENGVASSSFVQEPKELHFNLSSKILKNIEIAKINYQRACDDVDIEILKFNNFGKRFIKSHNISLDSFVQMAYQLTFYKLHGNSGVVCSVATLHKFYRGQYDLLHSTTTESLEFCKTMLDEASSTDLEKFISLRKALHKHKYLINEALNGNGINNLLIGLKIAAEENNFELPNIFKDKAYLNYLNIRVISSQVPGLDLLPVYISYGPFAEDGYGCPYFVYPDKLHFCVFSLKHNPETCSKSFLRRLETSLLEIKNIIVKFSEKSDKHIKKLRKNFHIN